MKHKHLHVYWIKGVFRWTLVVTDTPILDPTFYTNSTFREMGLTISPFTFSPLNKEQSFDFIKNKNSITTTHICYAIKDFLQVDKPTVEEYIFAMKIFKSIVKEPKTNKQHQYRFPCGT